MRYVGDNPNGSYRDIAGITNERGNVVGLMPHPEHAVEALTGPTHRRARLLHLGPASRWSRERGMIDTVEHAEATPEVEQPFARARPQGRRVRSGSARSSAAARPSAELAMYSVMWSEHCSYKSSQGAPAAVRREGADETDALLVGIGENAGVVDIGDGWAVTFKVESHNHPSYVEPYQGAATGVGGIVRDIMSMGARPVAVMDPLRFGPADAADTRRVLPGVVAGIGGYGNCLGLPNIGGEVVFDPSYAGNPLVNALCVGVMRHEDIKLAHASGAGNLVVLFGAATGGDGIGGVSVLASETFDDAKPSKRPAVQVGDPFTEKVLIECCLEVFAADLVVGIQDLGGAGLSCATSELASNGDGGMHVWLDRVPLRDATLRPEEILMSESQERMCAVVEPGKLDAFLAICAKWDVAGDRHRRGRRQRPAHRRSGTARRSSTCRRAPSRTRARSTSGRSPGRPGRTRCRPTAPRRPAAAGDRRRAARDAAADGRPRRTSRRSPGSPTSTTATSSATPCSRSPRTPASSGSTRRPAAASRWPPTATAGSRKLDPYAGAQLALAEAYRNVAVSRREAAGRHRLPELRLARGPGRDVAVRRGRPAAWPTRCLELGVPVTGGNVSFYNQTGDVAIHPTPVVGVLGVIDDVRRRTPIGFAAAGEVVLLLGATRDELGGSEWAHAVHGHLGGLPPPVDLAAEQALGAAAGRGCGGRAGRPRRTTSPTAGWRRRWSRWCCGAVSGRRWRSTGDPFVALFSESVARAVVSVPADRLADFEARASSYGVPVTRLGTTGGETLAVQGIPAVGLDELRAAHEGTLPALFG